MERRELVSTGMYTQKQADLNMEQCAEFMVRMIQKYGAEILEELESEGIQGSDCFLQALFPQKCRLNSSKLHGEFPQYCISSAGTLSGAGEEPLQAYKVY